MPASAGTVTSDTRVGNREELSDIVDLAVRRETPVYSMIGNSSASSKSPEWETEEVEAPGRNIQSEGRDYTFTVDAPVSRFKNYTQIFGKDAKYSRTQQQVSNAGKAETIDGAKVRKGIAIRRDVEFSVVDVLPSLDGVDRQSGSLATWAVSNVSRGATAANGGYNPATGVTAAPTNGTQRPFTKNLLDDLLELGFTSGVNLEHMFLSPYNKRVFATFMSDTNVAQFRYAAKGGANEKATIMGDAEVYQGPLGMVYAHPNHVMHGNADLARNVFVLDTTRIKWAWLHKIQEDPGLAKTGDFKQAVIQGEGCLKPLNEKAIGVIADTFGLTATT